MSSWAVDARCPDGQDMRVYLVHPTASPSDTGAADTSVTPAGQAVAIVFPSGALDARTAPVAGNPTSGPGLQDPTRLTRDWALRQAYVTLGMYPELDPTERHTGALISAFAQRDVAVLMPSNCWGDLWHNRSGVADNAVTEEFFNRNGRVSAEWAWQLVTDQSFAEALGVDFPISFDTSSIYLVGLGEGGRGVGELLALDENNDQQPDIVPAAVFLDSTVEDLNAFKANPALFAGTLGAFERIYPDGNLDAGALTTSRALPRMGYVYSTSDTTLPEGGNTRLITRLNARADQWVLTRTDARHVLSNGDPDVAASVVEFLLTGEKIEPGTAIDETGI